MIANKGIRVLFVDETAADVVLANRELRKIGLNFRSRRVDCREAFLRELESEPPDLILSDQGLPAFDGLTALALARQKCPQAPFIFLTDSLGEQKTIEAFEGGASGYVLKSELGRLGPVVERLLSGAEKRASSDGAAPPPGGPDPRVPTASSRRPADPNGLDENSANGSDDSRLLREGAEEALRKSEALKSAILDTVLDAIISLDHQGLVQEWNPAAERILGYTRSAALGKSLDELVVSPELRQAYQDGLSNYLVTGAGSLLGRPVEMTLCRADGTQFSAELAITRIPTEEPPWCTALIRDISSRKRAEEMIWDLNKQLEKRVLERTAQLEAANKELEAFTHSVSHFLQAPLRHVTAYVEILQREAASRLSDESKGHIEIIADAARSLGELINALQAFARLGNSAMREQRVSLAALVEAARRDLGFETEGRDITWEIAALPEVDGDPILLRQVLAHLLANALKFTGPRAHPKIEVGAFDGRLETVVFVRDNGVGFDMNYADKLFGVFQRLHPVSEFGGTGMGLANVRRIVRRHGGRAWAEGVVDGGATFYFSLPKLGRPKL